MHDIKVEDFTSTRQPENQLFTTKIAKTKRNKQNKQSKANTKPSISIFIILSSGFVFTLVQLKLSRVQHNLYDNSERSAFPAGN